MISWRARFFRLLSKQLFRRLSPDSDVQQTRRLFERTQRRQGVARGVKQHRDEMAGIPCLWLTPNRCDNAPVLFFLHGGAYLMGSPATHRHMASHIAREAGYRAVLPDYSLAPEKPFPAGLNDCLAVYRAMVSSGIPAGKIIIGGDSAGGGMTMAALMSLRDAGDPLPRAAVLLSPWLDLSASGESMQSRADDDPWFDPALMPHVAAYYCTPEQLQNPLVSPVFGSAGGLPPMLIQVGDHEILLSDSTRIADMIDAAGGDVTLEIWPHMWHVFQFFVGKMPESRRAIRQIAEFMTAQKVDGEEQ